MKLGLVAPLLLALAACASGGPRPLARVNEEVVTGEQLRREFGRTHRSLETVIGSEDEVRRYLSKLVDRRLFLQEARRMGLDESPEILEALAKYRAQKANEAFLKEMLEAPAAATDEEIFAAYTALVDVVEVRQLAFETREEAEAALGAISAGEDAEKLARERSIAPSAVRGGMLAVRWGGDEVLEREVMALEPGRLAGPFQTTHGWEVARIEARRQTPRPAFEKVSTQLRETVERRKRNALQKTLLEELWVEYDVRMHPCAPTLESLQAAAASKEAELCAEWKGGRLTTQDVISAVKLPQLAMMKPLYARLRAQIVEDLVNRRLSTAEALARGYGDRPEVAEKVRAHEEDLVESKLYAEWVLKGVSASDDEARAFHAANPQQFVQEPRYELAQIVLASAEEAAAVRKLVATGQPFEELVRAHSKDRQGAKQAGYAGVATRRALLGPLAVVTELKEGESTQPIEVDGSFRILKVLKIHPERPKPFEEVKEEARAGALRLKQAAAQARWVEQLRAAAKVRLDDRAIRAYEAERNALVREETRRAAARDAAKAARLAALAERAGALPQPAAPAPAAAREGGPTEPAPTPAAPDLAPVEKGPAPHAG